MPQPFVFMELSTPDAPTARTFYHELFDWRFEDPQPSASDYSIFRPEIGAAGAIYSLSGAPARWLPYINVDDIAAATEKAQTLGGTLVRGVQEVPGHGWTSILTDPQGAPFALYQNSQS